MLSLPGWAEDARPVETILPASVGYVLEWAFPADLDHHPPRHDDA
ncbi:MAG: hypothetical protein R3E98_11535 [Gemmatimonadota bacterium]